MNIIYSFRTFLADSTLLAIYIFLTALLFILLGLSMLLFGYSGYVAYGYLENIHISLSITSNVFIAYLFLKFANAIYAFWDWTMNTMSNWLD